MVNYYLRFGAGDPRTLTGLSPTFLIFNKFDGSAVSPPAITELVASSGIYTFQFGTTQSIAFLADAATTSPGSAGRYVVGELDPTDAGAVVSGVGTVGSTFGGVSSDPIDLFGYVKRIQENLEGNSIYFKSSGAFQILSRGSSTVLANKTIANSVSLVTKT